MNYITQDSLAEIEFQLRWKSSEAEHEERLLTKVNFWRDILPPGVSNQLMGKRSGDRVEASYTPQAGLLPNSPANRITVNRNQFFSETLTPRYGRFYPLGVLRGLPCVFPGNIKPFRVKGIDETCIQADLNHPLADVGLDLTAEVQDTFVKPSKHGCAGSHERLAVPCPGKFRREIPDRAGNERGGNGG
ncbi:MAG: hypothetical protein COX19_09440 [Desulfobacterales bacterium CG23_combo_of_CG06-09_8_20_14_all_51_8]|nr:MAG: hypothetical protein COX19_09440 [Desulfobacterales bacterium CG23_combo_of_CG06-09_8_20_14_all_51_8]